MEWNPEEYSKNSSQQLLWARQLLAKLDLKGHEVLLDVGCGDGKISAEVAGAVPNGFVLGIDSSPAFIEFARSHHLPESHPNLRFEQMDARRMAYDRHFDIIFSNAALHWVEDHRGFLAGCKRLLNPGGRLLISCGGRGNAASVFPVLDKIIAEPAWTGFFTGFTFPYFFYAPSDYAHWLPEAGLTPVRIELVEKDMVHAGKTGLVGWIKTTWLPYTGRVPQELRSAFIDRIIDEYLRNNPLDQDGNCHIRMVRLEIEAKN